MLLMRKYLSDPYHSKQTMKLIRQMSVAAATKEKPKSEPKPLSKADWESPSFVKNLFRSRMDPTQMFPYPQPLTQEQLDTIAMLKDPLEKFFEEVNNPDKNDLDEVIETKTLDGLWEMGAFSIQVPHEYGGLGLNNTQYARMVEIVGKHDLAVGICLGAHQSIGFKGILLFGNKEQKEKYLPMVSTEKVYAAFCLTEPSAGSDAASVRSRAVPSADGSHYILNGSKVWISNGGIANVLTVFAQTPVKDEKTGQEKVKLTAFIVERGFGGVTSGPPEKKMGIKASNTTEVFFDNVKVPKENVLGGIGNGFKIAMNILNNGRFGMVACLAGTMRTSIMKATDFATQRLQFGQKIDSYQTIQEKLAKMCMYQYVTESLAYMVSGNMDMGCTEYHLEAAISKIFASEAAWMVTDEAIQIMGGMGYMRGTGLEKILRDLRVFRIFEGTNDILRLMIALTGIQYLGASWQNIMKMFKARKIGGVMSEFGDILSTRMDTKFQKLAHPSLANESALCHKCANLVGSTSMSMMFTYKENVVQEQFLLNRLADAVIHTYAMAVVVSRCSMSLEKGLPSADYELKLTKSWCKYANEKVNSCLTEIKRDKEHFQRMSDIAKEVCKELGVPQFSPVHM